MRRMHWHLEMGGAGTTLPAHFAFTTITYERSTFEKMSGFFSRLKKRGADKNQPPTPSPTPAVENVDKKSEERKNTPSKESSPALSTVSNVASYFIVDEVLTVSCLLYSRMSLLVLNTR